MKRDLAIETNGSGVTRPRAFALGRESFTWAAMGLALCISAPEAVRYSALWHVSDEGSLLGIVCKTTYLLGCFLAVRLAGSQSHTPLYRNRLLLVTLVSLQTIGFLLLAASSLGWTPPPLVSATRDALLDSSFFLFSVFASFYARATVKTAITSLIAGVVIAGTIQICVALLPFCAAAVLVMLFAPLSALFLRFADRRANAAEPQSSSSWEPERSAFEDEQETSPVQAKKSADARPASARALFATIGLLSFVVAAIHLSWLDVQDGSTASMMVQVCAGIGTVLAGNILFVVRNRLDDCEVIEFTRLIVLPVAITTLYAGSLLNGALIALAVIPLNIVYVAVLLLAWLAPFAYAEGRHPVAVSCDAFLAKRLGVVVGIGLMRDLAVGDFAWLDTAMIVAALASLILLSVIQFFNEKRQAIQAAAQSTARPIADPEKMQNLACARVAARIRLTPREQEVLELLSRGRTAGYIADELVISSTTAKTHIKHIYQKADMRSKQALLDIVEGEVRESASHCAREREGL